MTTWTNLADGTSPAVSIEAAASALAAAGSAAAAAGSQSAAAASAAAAAASLALKADVASPTFTGVPAAPTAAAATSTTQLATTAFVTTADNLKANLASPTFTGTVTAPTLVVTGQITGSVTATGSTTARTLPARFADSLSVKDFSAVGDGTTNDAAEIQTALNSLTPHGGTLRLSSGRYYCASSLTIPANVTLVGPVNPGEQWYSAGVVQRDYRQVYGSIILGPAATITLNDGAGLRDCLIIQKAVYDLMPCSDATTAAAMIAAFTGTALQPDGQDVNLQRLLILGFTTAVYSDGNTYGVERLRMLDVGIDCTNGVDLLQSQDVAYLTRVHCWPFTTTHANWTTEAVQRRSGTGLRLATGCAWCKLNQCFTYAFAIGYHIDAAGVTNLVDCSYDGTPTGTSTAIGFKIENGARNTTMIACQCATAGTAVDVNLSSGARDTVKIDGCVFWSNDTYNIKVTNGQVIATNNTFGAGGATGIRLESTATGIVCVANFFEDLTTPFDFQGSTFNTSVVLNNLFRNCTTTYADADLGARQTSTGSTSVGRRIRTPQDTMVSIEPNLTKVLQLRSPDTSRVNYFQMSGGLTGNPASLYALGSDTNVDISFVPQAAGYVWLGGPAWTASGDTATNGYLQVKDKTGAVRKIPTIA